MTVSTFVGKLCCRQLAPAFVVLFSACKLISHIKITLKLFCVVNSLIVCQYQCFGRRYYCLFIIQFSVIVILSRYGHRAVFKSEQRFGIQFDLRCIKLLRAAPIHKVWYLKLKFSFSKSLNIAAIFESYSYGNRFVIAVCLGFINPIVTGRIDYSLSIFVFRHNRAGIPLFRVFFDPRYVCSVLCDCGFNKMRTYIPVCSFVLKRNTVAATVMCVFGLSAAKHHAAAFIGVLMILRTGDSCLIAALCMGMLRKFTGKSCGHSFTGHTQLPEH